MSDKPNHNLDHSPDTRSPYAQWFRSSTPYISAHRGKTFVVLLRDEALNDAGLTSIVHDLALLQVLGVHMVLVHGSRAQIDARIDNPRFAGNRRITSAEDMTTVAGVCGELRVQLEALFSTGLPNTPLHNVDIPVVSGNFIAAQPLGVIDGEDHLYTGRVRRVHTARLRTALDAGALVLQSPIGFSPSGQAFNLSADEVATEVAVALGADKLILLDTLAHLADGTGQRRSTVTPAQLDAYARDADQALAARLTALAKAVRRGVQKAHILAFADDGALLQELFTAQGVGTQILEDPASLVRAATQEDVGDIVEVIRPLEESGALVRRSRDRLEQEIEHFFVAEVDGVIAGCCALYPYVDNNADDAQAQTQGELACVAVGEGFRQDGSGIGSALLMFAERAAVSAGLTQLFVLTTQTRDWFLEHGFTDADPQHLPNEKQDLYNWQRNSKVLTKQLAREPG